MSKHKFTPGPWAIEALGGHELTGVEAEIAEAQDCEAYALRQLKIVAPSKPTGAKRRNKETGKFDISVPTTACEIVYDPRFPGGACHEADARLIAAAPDMYEALPDLSAVITWLRNGCDPKGACTELEIYQARIAAAKAKAEGRS